MQIPPEQIFSLIAAGLRATTPIALAAIGITLSEAAGIIHLSAEGVMLSSALTAVVATHYTGSPWLGLLTAILTGLLFGALMGVTAINLRANQIIVGFGVNFIGTGITPVLLERVWGSRGRSGAVAGLPHLEWEWLTKVPVVGPILDGQSVLFFAMLALLAVTWVVFHRTSYGLRLRMVGEHPGAAATAGIRVNRVRYVAVLVGCALCAIAGAELSLGQILLFGRNMTAGRGFVAVAANVVGGWRPMGSFLASLLFGLADALQLRLQGGIIPNHFIQMIPYLLTVLVVSGIGGRRPPLAIGTHFDPEEK